MMIALLGLILKSFTLECRNGVPAVAGFAKNLVILICIMKPNNILRIRQLFLGIH